MSGTSLLAQLYPYFKGSQEDVATASLRYIITSDEILNIAFTRLVKDKLYISSIEDQLQYECQITGRSEEKERPDMSGFDRMGNEQLLCESKFYAALTVNQPNTYLRRLIDERGAGLIFICPELRIASLWKELSARIKEKDDFTITEVSDYCKDINGVRLGIVSWREIITCLSDVALKNNINQMDIMQLKGYCERLDSDAFIPFDEKDFGIENAIKQERHVILIEELFKALKADSALGIWTGKSNLHSAPQRTGYAKYFKIFGEDGYCASLVMDTVKWKNPGSYITPYWIRLCKEIDGDWKMDAYCKKALCILDDKKDGEFLALEARCYVTLDEIVKSMKNQIIEYLKIFEEVRKEQ